MQLKDFAEQSLKEFGVRLYRALDGLTFEELNWRPRPEANSIAFIVWHVARVEDGWFQHFVRDTTQVWIEQSWYERLGLPEKSSGFGYSVEQLAAFPALREEDLRGYFDAVRKSTLFCLRDMTEADLDRVPGRSPFPGSPSSSRFAEFTVARMFRQLIGEEYQHLGHVNYIRGLQWGLDG